MRLRIEVMTGATELAWAKVLSPGRSLLYDLLTREAPDLGRRLHARGAGPYGMVPLGHGAPVFPRAVKVRGRYAVGGRGHLELGSPLLEAVTAMAQGIKQRELLDWGGAAFRVLNATLVEPPAFASGRALLRTLTPVVVKGTGVNALGERTTRQAWLLPADREFPECFQRNLRRKAETLGLDPEVSLTRITWVGPRRSFAVGSAGAVRGGKSGAPVEVELTGAPETLQAIWSWGLGEANPAGFGWIG
ncbi:CRISPR-associated endoribonuclease Cas6 [Streptosporangium saharense]|uniref:CRISPR-associated endoribonuclease Cas6 n=1 Tax=Streptosporangium saharense TaxID=1706840 RepID=A0A7W7QI16_9ACTN|nr:CRISPR-associated endoribonuclease Cas6 [Streptosporangium saharense]MBB4913990.1 CRISPR-associated endoribonuclease Cas6 [Streptosporangium saharense]